MDENLCIWQSGTVGPDPVDRVEAGGQLNAVDVELGAE